MNILMVYPHCPDSFWSFRYALRFISKKSSDPPLGLLTVAGILPKEWNKKLVDMNVSTLKNKDILKADYVFISAMSIQETSVWEVIRRCQKLRRKIVAGGPLFTEQPDKFSMIEHLILGEAEITLPQFLSDLQNGNPRPVYHAEGWSDITQTTIPQWDLINMRHYVSMDLQYSRGCPYQCSFCEISILFGNEVRTKGREQIIAELEALYQHGWRRQVFLVDDNFIGNKVKLKTEILPAITTWMEQKGHPFSFYTECSINLADDESLMKQMAAAGFNKVFIGIESVNEDSLAECEKYTNCKRDLVTSVHKIQSFGMEVMGGFIIGFDHDNPSIFNGMIKFIQESGIITAMVGLLNAPFNTKLYKQMLSEGRLKTSMSGDNTDLSMNFKPAMKYEQLVSGYKQVLHNIYSPQPFYQRMRKYLEMNQDTFHKQKVHFNEILAFFKTLFVLGITGKERPYYWRMIFWSIFYKRQVFRQVITYSIYGYHFRKMMYKYLRHYQITANS